MRRRPSPVQQWVDSIPSPTKSSALFSNGQLRENSNKLSSSMTTEPRNIASPKKNYSKIPNMTVSAPVNIPCSTTIGTPGVSSSLPHSRLARDPSLQSDSSHCSSVESLLELRKADPEAVLLSLGFGGCSSSPRENGPLSRIPKRFLQPSKLKGIAINDFVKHQQETSESIDSVSLGYRGLTGSPYVAPSEIVQKIMERLREHESHEMDGYSTYCYEQCTSIQQGNRHSVLSPDNRQFLDQPRSRSPDMRNKRMIIGQKSFAFGCNGDLIEISTSDTRELVTRNSNRLSNVEDSTEIVDSVELNPRSMQMNEGKLLKILPFDESIESHEPANSSIYEDNRSANKPEDYDKEPVVDSQVSNLKVKNAAKLIVTSPSGDKCDFLKHFDSRRSSEGLCDVKCEESKAAAQENRRFSDGTIQVKNDKGKESSLSYRRKGFKRQSRISEMDAIRYCDQDREISILKDNVPHSDFSDSKIKLIKGKTDTEWLDSRKDFHQSSDKNSRSKCTIDCAAGVAQSDALAASEIRKRTQEIDDTSLGEGSLKNGNCSSCESQFDESFEKTDKLSEDSTDYYCHGDNKKCWNEMKKIMKENKKLETMITKNRIEMAEIRDMLSSVLSVRMEPGF